ncbi:MAG: type IV pilus assembly protein PilM [Planctomycetota bacterium]|jgi:type IV pilus assembly protein PilM
MKWHWRRSLKLEHDDVVGLDIGSSEVKLVQLRRSGSAYEVTAASTAGIACGEGNGSPREIDTVKAIRQCIRSAGTQTRMAVCGLRGPEVAVRDFRFPSLPSQEVEGAVMLEAAQVCPFNIDDGAVDYQLVPNGNGSVCGVLVAATNQLIRMRKQLVKEASLKCALMDVDGLALLNCFNGFSPPERGKHKSPRTTAILDVGNSYTTLSIMGGSGLPFVRDIACAGNEMLAQIAAKNNISADQARRILSGSENPAESEPKLRDSLAKACRKLIVDVTETLRFCTAKEKSAVVEKILVCGGFALVKGFVELLDSQLPASAVLWNPFDGISCRGHRSCEEILADRGPAMAVAAGLAMRSI